MARPKDPNSKAGLIRAELDKDATAPSAVIAAKVGCKTNYVSAVRSKYKPVRPAVAAAVAAAVTAPPKPVSPPAL